MKKLLLVLLVLAFLVQPALAQGPDHQIYLPYVAGGNMGSFAVLQITDGVTSIDLLRGPIYLTDWTPSVPQSKGGGVWQDSPLATGRRLVDRRFGNVTDSLTLDVSTLNQDDTIRSASDLFRLLEKARDFGTSGWQSDPVWIKRQAACETSPTYALIFDYRITDMGGNPYTAPFFGERSTLNAFALILEHSIWLGSRPGTGECVQASGVQDWVYQAQWQLNTAQPVAAVMDIIHLRSLPNRMLAGEEDEVWRTDTGGAVWTAATTPPGIHVRTMVEDSAGNVYAAGDTGIWRSVDGGDNWVQRNAVRGTTGVVNQALTIDDTDVLYLADYFNGIYKSTDGGATWNLLYAATAVSGILNTQYGLIATFDSDDPPVMRSIDSGVTWSAVFTSQLISMISDPGDGYIYLGTRTATPTYLYRSNNGTNWSLVSTLPLVVTASREMILASDGIYYWANGGGEIYISRDAIAWTLQYTAPSQVWALAEYTQPTIYAGATGNIYYNTHGGTTAVGAATTCADDVFVANKANASNLTHIYIDDGGAWSANLFPMAALPVTLLPAAPAIGDALYVGIDTSVIDSGPFESLVWDLLDIITYATSYTITPEYYTGAAWATLTMQDGTNPGTGMFRTLGVSSMHWTPPANWATRALNLDGGPAVTGYWVRFRVSALVGAMTAPSQQTRNPYTVILPYADIAAAQVSGDIPALAEIKLHNRSDKDGRAANAPNLYDNRIVVSLRSYDRGPTFTAYLNASDEQNPVGVTVGVGAGTAIAAGISGITGRLATYTAALGDTTFADQITFTLGSTIARDYYGAFHAFLRAGVTAGASSDIHARLQVRTGSGGVTFTSSDDYLKGTTDYEVLDLGRVTIPASGVLSFDDLGDSTVLAVQFRNDSGAARTVYIHDLILIPVDEWQMDAVDMANITASVIGRQSSTPHLLDIDSLAYQKVDIRTPVRTADANGFVTAIYLPNSPGPAILQANARQRLWVFAMRTSATGATYNWLAEPWIAHSIQIWASFRYLGYRGDR